MDGEAVFSIRDKDRVTGFWKWPKLFLLQPSNRVVKPRRLKLSGRPSPQK